MLRYAVLASLAATEAHGYELLSRLKEHGFGRLTGGVIYPLLRRLEEEGLLSHRWDTQTRGPARKVLQLTESGREDLLQADKAWQDLSDDLARLRREKTA